MDIVACFVTRHRAQVKIVQYAFGNRLHGRRLHHARKRPVTDEHHLQRVAVTHPQLRQFTQRTQRARVQIARVLDDDQWRIARSGLLERKYAHEAEKLIGGAQVHVVAELSQHRVQQPGRIEPAAVDQGNSAVFVEGLEEAADQDRFARKCGPLEQANTGRVLVRLAQGVERILLRLVGDDGKWFAMCREGLFAKACRP